MSAISSKYVADAIHLMAQRQQPQPAPLFAPHKEERPVRYGHVRQWIKNGDRMLYSGSMLNPVSASNRIFQYSQFSHVGISAVGSDGPDIIDFTCVKGCSRHSLGEAVMAKPGRWYWSPVDQDAYPRFDGKIAVDAAMEMLGQGYGYAGIVLQLAMRTPGCREVCYATALDRLAWFSKHKFCSFGVDLWAIAAGENPVPSRQPQLCTPQDIAQSKLWIPKIVPLIP